MLHKFSIITPSFNQARFLEENIKSVLDQQYPSAEHIIIDGGSTDGTLAILKKYPHLQWVSEPDRGQAHALNKGIAKANGEIIGWINSDDGYLADTLTEVAELFERPDVMVVYGDGDEIDESSTLLRTIVPCGIERESFIRYWWWQYEYCQPSFFFRHQALQRVGFLNENLHYTMDHDLLIRLIGEYEFTYLPKRLSYYRLHGHSKTGTTHRMVIPTSVWELHKVSRSYWGSPREWRYYSYLFSFFGGILLSFVKNIFFIRHSKSRAYLQRLVAK